MRDRIDLGNERHAAVHGDRQRLCSAHAAQPGSHDEPPRSEPPKC